MDVMDALVRVSSSHKEAHKSRLRDLIVRRTATKVEIVLVRHGHQWSAAHRARAGNDAPHVSVAMLQPAFEACAVHVRMVTALERRHALNHALVADYATIFIHLSFFF